MQHTFVKITEKPADVDSYLMTVEEFRAAVKVGGFNEDDGIGFLGDTDTETNINVWECTPQQIQQYTHVHWYNK